MTEQLYAVWATPVKDPLLSLARTGEPIAFWVTRPGSYTEASIALSLQKPNPYWTYDVRPRLATYRRTAWERLINSELQD